MLGEARSFTFSPAPHHQCLNINKGIVKTLVKVYATFKELAYFVDELLILWLQSYKTKHTGNCFRRGWSQAPDAV